MSYYNFITKRNYGKNQRKKLQRDALFKASQSPPVEPNETPIEPPSMEKYPLHVTQLKGHKASDVIVIYGKYEDFQKENRDPKALGLFVPQWFCTDMVNDTSGIMYPLSQPVLCTYAQMSEMSIATLKKMVRGPFGLTKFYYSNTLVGMNEQFPFS